MIDFLFIILSSCIAIGLEFLVDILFSRKNFKLSLWFYGTYFILLCLSMWTLITMFNN